MLLLLRRPSLAAARSSVRDYKPPGAAAYKGGAITNPEDWVSTLTGTRALGGQEVSYGNVLPEVTYPWGFNGWVPASNLDTGGWFFHSEAFNFYGIRCTKQPSPWISDYGQFRIASMTIDDNHDNFDVYSAYDPAQSQWSPYYFNASLLPAGLRSGYAGVEVAPTMHGAAIKFTFQPFHAGAFDGGYNQTRRVLISLDSGAGALDIPGAGPDGLLVATGASVANSGGVPAGWGGHYFYATVGGGADGAAPLAPFSSAVARGGTKWLYFDFDPTDAASNTLVVRIATSLVSPAQAQANHAAQVAGRAFDDVKAAAKAAWNAELSRVAIADAGAAWPAAQAVSLATIFYSSLYRAAKFPRAAWEFDYANGSAPIHWSPYTNAVEPGVFSTDQGFWDACAYAATSSPRPARGSL
jgi:putative alpha-1,2-mannosidase